MVKKRVKFRHEITCCECGSVFHSVRSDARFCSEKCKKHASLRNIAMRKEKEEREFAIAVDREEHLVSNNNMIILVHAIQAHKHKIEVRNNGERRLREYHSIIIKREKRMQCERFMRQKENEAWKCTQERLRAENERQLRIYQNKVALTLQHIRNLQWRCKMRWWRIDEERERARIARQREWERRQRERERRLRCEMDKKESEMRERNKEHARKVQKEQQQAKIALFERLMKRFLQL